MWQRRIMYVLIGLGASWSPQLVFILFVALFAMIIGRCAVGRDRNPVGFCFLAVAIPLGLYGWAGLPFPFTWQYWAALPSGLIVWAAFPGLEWFDRYRAIRYCCPMEVPDDRDGH